VRCEIEKRRAQVVRLRKSLKEESKNRRWLWALGERGEVQRRLDGGEKIVLFANSILSKRIFFREFEQKEICFFRRFLRKEDIVIDIGANIGLFVIISAKSVGPKGRVIAFEPVSDIFQKLNKNIRINGFENVLVMKQGLSDVECEKEMYQYGGGYDAWNSLAVDAKMKKRHGVEKSVVRLTTLDRFVRTSMLEGKIALIKIDVEGWEGKVIEGGENTLLHADAPVLQVEFDDQRAQVAGSSCRQLYAQLEGLGYRLFGYDESANELVWDPPREWYSYTNLYAIKDLDSANRRLQAR